MPREIEVAAAAALAGTDSEIEHAGLFETKEKQAHAARLGMWLFLASEVMLFAGLFVAYSLYRVSFPAAFAAAVRHMNVAVGTVNTLVLLASSLAVALGLHFARCNRRWMTVAMLGLTLVCGVLFLSAKAVEWVHHARHGALPGAYYDLRDVPLPGAPLFFTMYFLMTGLHALHVTLGMGALSWLTVSCARGAFSSTYDTPLELGALYWHFVDVIWIFLYPLLYLA